MLVNDLAKANALRRQHRVASRSVFIWALWQSWVSGLDGGRAKKLVVSVTDGRLSQAPRTLINAEPLQNALIHAITAIMSEGMSSWRSLASSAGTRFKGYINSDQGLKGTHTPRGFQAAPQEERQNWREWAGQKVKLRRKGNGDVGLVNTEIVSLFPGWAARRYPSDTGTEGASLTAQLRGL